MNVSTGLSHDQFARLQEEHRLHGRGALHAIGTDGHLLFQADTESGWHHGLWVDARKKALAEALRWGEPTIQSGPENHLLWAVPIMQNSALLAGVVVVIGEDEVFAKETGAPLFDVRAACTSLRLLVEKYNLTNSELLEKRRTTYRHEQIRAETIHAIKLDSHYNLRASYLREEPDLLAAIRKGHIHEVRERINSLLAAVTHHVGGDVELTKSYFMELVIMMCRTAVEAGGNEQELLGTNYAQIAELFRCESMEDIAPWLHRTLEHIFDSLRHSKRDNTPMLLNVAIHYITNHLTEDITRDEVARVASMSPTHFSRVFHRHVGRRFVDFLNQMRVDRACEFLNRSDKPIALIALDVGFRSQSYFTKVFKRYNGMSPGAYRESRTG